MVKIKITKNPIAPSSAIRQVTLGRCGGISVFIGTIRDNFNGKDVKKVHIEAYDAMVRNDLQKIADEVRSKYDIGEISIVHRIGDLDVGEVVVVIAVSAPHRKDAFSACEEIIDKMKKTTPIWKQEFLSDGSRWVESEDQ